MSSSDGKYGISLTDHSHSLNVHISSSNQMRLSAAISLVCLVPLTLAQDVDVKVVQAYFEKYNIPKDLGITFKPTQLLNLYFPQSNTAGGLLPVNTGDSVLRNATVGPPRFALSPARATEPVNPQYVIIAIDPDAPTPENPTNAQLRHLLAGNFVHSNNVTPVPSIPWLVNRTAAITDYRQPTPPPSVLGSPHRYIFLAYAQSKTFTNQTLVTLETPINLWNVAKFAEALGLGDPVGGTFFLVKPGVRIGTPQD